MNEVDALRQRLQDNLQGKPLDRILTSDIPRAWRAKAELTTWGKGIAGFWSIEGKPGIWVWRKGARKGNGTYVQQPGMVVAQQAFKLPGEKIELAGIGCFTRELKLEAFFQLKGVGE